MNETEHPKEGNDYPNPFPPNGETTSGADAPKQEKIACHHIEKAKQFWRRWMTHPIVCFVQWIDNHDGVVTAAATVAIACLTWSLTQDSRRQADTANDQSRIMRRQLDAMEADQRPWVSIDEDSHSDIVWDERGARISVFFKLNNVGKSPAANVHFEAKSVLPKIGEPATPLNAMMEYAADIERRRATSKVAGDFYFPDHNYRAGMGLLIERSEFQALLKASGSPDISLACADYRIGSRDEPKRTCTSYYIEVVNPEKPGTFTGLRLDQNVSSDHIAIGAAFYSYAD